jgi:hypothetical protein
MRKAVARGLGAAPDAWVDGDIELKVSLSGYKFDVYDLVAEGNTVVTRWVFGGVHMGTILGIPPSVDPGHEQTSITHRDSPHTRCATACGVRT